MIPSSQSGDISTPSHIHHFHTRKLKVSHDIRVVEQSICRDIVDGKLCGACIDSKRNGDVIVEESSIYYGPENSVKYAIWVKELEGKI